MKKEIPKIFAGNDEFMQDDYCNMILNELRAYDTIFDVINSKELKIILKFLFTKGKSDDLLELHHYALIGMVIPLVRDNGFEYSVAESSLDYKTFKKNNKQFLNVVPSLSKQKQDNLQHNIEILRKNYVTLQPLPLDNQEPLEVYKIDKFLGAGAYGKVFSLAGTNRVIKIFTSAVSLERDLNRFRKTMDQIYSKEEKKITSMPIFDEGKLSFEYYYVIMPRLIPFGSTEQYHNNVEFFDELFYCIMDVGIEARHANKISSFPSFAKDVYSRLFRHIKKVSKEDERAKMFRPLDFKPRYSRNTFLENRIAVDRIILAAYRAIKDFGGRDLHSGNIGYLPQKPDTFVFYDM